MCNFCKLFIHVHQFILNQINSLLTTARRDATSWGTASRVHRIQWGILNRKKWIDSNIPH